MKTAHYLVLLSMTIGMFLPRPLANVNAEDVPNVMIKADKASVLTGEPFSLAFFLSASNDLYGLQIDMMTDVDENAIPAHPINVATPFVFDERCLFDGDYVFANKVEDSTKITSLLVTRQLHEASGYSFQRPRLLTTIQLLADANIPDLRASLLVSDDLLTMQMGQTNITLKLSNSSGSKIAYGLGVADGTKPTISIPNSKIFISVGGNFEANGSFSVTDDTSPLEYLSISVYEYAHLDQVGEYVVTIFAEDEFFNFSIGLITLVVGDPYVNVSIQWEVIQ